MIKIRKPQFFSQITSKNKKNIYKKHLQKLTTAICLLVKGGGLCKPVLNELRSWSLLCRLSGCGRPPPPPPPRPARRPLLPWLVPPPRPFRPLWLPLSLEAPLSSSAIFRSRSRISSWRCNSRSTWNHFEIEICWLAWNNKVMLIIEFLTLLK